MLLCAHRHTSHPPIIRWMQLAFFHLRPASPQICLQYRYLSNGTAPLVLSALVVYRIEHLAFSKRWANDGSHDVLLLGDLVRSYHDDVLGNANIVQCHAHLDLLFALGASDQHDDEEINVAIRPGCPARVRAEQNELIPVKTIHEAAHHLLDILADDSPQVASSFFIVSLVVYACVCPKSARCFESFSFALAGCHSQLYCISGQAAWTVAATAPQSVWTCGRWGAGRVL